MAAEGSMHPGSRASQTLAFNMKLLAHHELGGFGGIGEGMNMQKTKDGRRILWMAHECAPKSVTAMDVTDPRNPKMVVQTELPHGKMRSNSLDVVGDVMVVAYQIRGERGTKPCGFDLIDISTPEKPRLITHFDASGPDSLGCHFVWFVDGETVHMSSGAPDFKPINPKDHQCYRIIDVKNTSKPQEVGRWWYPGQCEGDDAPLLPRHPRFDSGYRPHNINVYPQRPDRAYVAYLDGGLVILDISDKSRPKEISRYNYSPPYNGFTHTVLPLFDKGLLIVTDECTKDDGLDWPKLAWVIDARDETNLVPISTLPLPPFEAFSKRGGRFGAHNLYENYPGPLAWRSEEIVVGAFFNAGLRAYDMSNPYQPKEVGYFVPGAPAKSPKGAIQMNDVYIDDRGVVFAADRFAGGLYVIEMNF
jgi:hypothetical protein